ncbi:hypothetical protein E8E13_011342 [Curvularia kusanoi]|uniref:Protein kinase domain-containing protein n=1 Tax=Curvularia kusanoi TaxID=90978 RepID=A0A9P4TN54_CURKU|nr:hypothetical protein E8E13_011342 [Curvularia kusanoi]
MDLGRLPPGFSYVAKAGQGSTSEVRFCLPDIDIQSFLTLNEGLAGDLSASSPGFGLLRKSLVALKILELTWNFEIERRVLQKFKDSEGAHARIIRQQILDVKSVGTFPVRGRSAPIAYIELEAVNPAITLKDMFTHCEIENVKIPLLLVYDLFISLGSVVIFLRDKLGKSHTDINNTNILVRMIDGDASGIPNFVLIDFGQVTDYVSYEDSVTKDCQAVLRLVHKMACLAEDSNDQDWAEFNIMLREELRRACWNVDSGFKVTYDKWSRILARKIGEELLDAEAGKIRGFFEQVAEARGGVGDALLLRAVREYMKAKDPPFGGIDQT